MKLTKFGKKKKKKKKTLSSDLWKQEVGLRVAMLKTWTAFNSGTFQNYKILYQVSNFT